MSITSITVYTRNEIRDVIKENGGKWSYLPSLISGGIVSKNTCPTGIHLYYLSNPVDLECKVREWAASEADNAK